MVIDLAFSDIQKIGRQVKGEALRLARGVVHDHD
jgi:hypothetical protein